MNILGKLVVLRAVEAQDLETLHEWANDPEIWPMLGGWHFPSNMDYMVRWHESLKNDKLNQRLVIDVPEVGVVGTANLVDIDWKNRNAFHGVMLGNSEVRRRGYAKDAVMAIMRYAFEELGMQRLDTTIIEYNEPSLRLYIDKCGWQEEGRQRNWYFRKNRYWDRIMLGLTRDQYFDNQAQNNYWENGA